MLRLWKPIWCQPTVCRVFDIEWVGRDMFTLCRLVVLCSTSLPGSLLHLDVIGDTSPNSVVDAHVQKQQDTQLETLIVLSRRCRSRKTSPWNSTMTPFPLPEIMSCQNSLRMLSPVVSAASSRAYSSSSKKSMSNQCVAAELAYVTYLEDCFLQSCRLPCQW